MNGVEVKLHAFLTLAVDGREWSVAESCPFRRNDKWIWITVDRLPLW